eukprot:gene14364-15862_t
MAEKAQNCEGLVMHNGGCHCGRVRFSVQAPTSLDCINCNCSICKKKQNIHFIVPEANFTLIQGKDNLTCYTFNTHCAKHLFCKTCGVQSFYKPRSNPDGYGIMPHCLDSGTVKSINVDKFDGLNWEECMEENKEKFESFSKE